MRHYTATDADKCRDAHHPKRWHAYDPFFGTWDCWERPWPWFDVGVTHIEFAPNRYLRLRFGCGCTVTHMYTGWQPLHEVCCIEHLRLNMYEEDDGLPTLD